MKHIIVSSTTGDEYYFNMMKVFLASLHAYEPGVGVHVDLANGTEDQEFALIWIHPRTTVTHIKTTDAMDFIFSRISQMQALLLSSYDIITSIDSDCIIRGDISRLWDIGPNEMLIWHKTKGKHTDAVRFQGGVYSLYRTPETALFYTDLANYVFANKNERLVGQLAIKIMLEKYAGMIKHVQLEEKYNDCNFRKNSIIWHAKGSHRNDKRYLKTFKKILEKT